MKRVESYVNLAADGGEVWTSLSRIRSPQTV